MCKQDLLRLFKEQTGGKTKVEVPDLHPGEIQVVGYQPPRHDKVHTYWRG